MKTLCLILIFGILSTQVLGMSYRYKRQSDEGGRPDEDYNFEEDYQSDEDSRSGEDVLKDKDGPNGPNQGQSGFKPGPVPNPLPSLLPDSTPPQTTSTANLGQDNVTLLQTPLPPQTTFAPNQGQNQTTLTPTPNSNQNGNSQATVQSCIQTCPVTSEYNPVCGTNGVTYGNPSRLFCAQSCGETVNFLRSSRCPATTPPPS